MHVNTRKSPVWRRLQERLSAQLRLLGTPADDHFSRSSSRTPWAVQAAACALDPPQKTRIVFEFVVEPLVYRFDFLFKVFCWVAAEIQPG